MNEEQNNDGGKKKKSRQKNKEQRESNIPQVFLQIFELMKMSGFSRSKIKLAIKNGHLKTSQTCERGVHLIHITEANRWLDGQKGNGPK